MKKYDQDGVYKGFPSETDNGYKLSINKETSTIKIKSEIQSIEEKINEINNRIKLLEEDIFNKIKNI